MIDVVEKFYRNKPFQLLANAIVVQAAKDYKTAFLRLRKEPESETAVSEILRLERFFGSGWYQFLTGVDGEYLMRRIREEVLKETVKKKTKLKGKKNG